MKKLKKLLSLALCVVFLVAFSTTSLAAETSKTINVYLEAGQGVTYTISTPSVFDVYVNFSQASPRFAVQVDDKSSVVMQKIFTKSTPISYVDKGGYYRNGTMKLTIFNDSNYEGNFVGTVRFVEHK